MDDLLYPKAIIKKINFIKNLALKNNYEKIIEPLDEILAFFNDIYDPVFKSDLVEFNIHNYKLEILAYYLSRFDHYDIFPSLNQNEAFEKISKLVNVQKSTLRILRDRYDSKTTKIKKKESPYLKIRKGINFPLSKKEEEIFNYYKNKKRVEILKDIIQIFKKNSV